MLNILLLSNLLLHLQILYSLRSRLYSNIFYFLSSGDPQFCIPSSKIWISYFLWFILVDACFCFCLFMILVILYVPIFSFFFSLTKSGRFYWFYTLLVCVLNFHVIFKLRECVPYSLLTEFEKVFYLHKHRGSLF